MPEQPNKDYKIQICSTRCKDLTSRTELDSHANMVVLGSECFVFDNILNQTCEVEPFDPTIGTAKRVPIVDAALAYDCQYSHKTYILVLRNALHIPSMTHNLLPPFILREAGIKCNDIPKIHCVDPSNQDHCISFPDSSLRIPLMLCGIFSYFGCGDYRFLYWNSTFGFFILKFSQNVIFAVTRRTKSLTIWLEGSDRK